MYINKAFVYGNLTRDPELRSLPSGIQVATFSVATNRVYKDKEGNRKESADYHNIVVFGRQAETTNQYMRKGSAVFVEGRMQTRSWESDGQKKYRTEIVADRIQFGPKAGGAPVGGQTNSAPAAAVASGASAAPAPSSQGGGDAIEYPEEEINPEDIPF
ncbi:single-stranded DNA-binding protein [Candidatus Wolfebacteria bacterium]|nr:MAG: single-stranded DNA-binding protein [Candidatus Wolfebacteria bacterium]